MEAERSKHGRLAERLQERLNTAQEEISSLQSSIAQKASQYQNLQTDLLGKVSQATDTEKEASQVKKVISSSGSCLTFCLIIFFSLVKAEKCSRGFTGETVTGEKLCLQPSSDDQHWATESSAGTNTLLIICHP